MSEIPILKSYGMVYLATPYSKFHGGIESAFRYAAKVAALLIRHQVNVYSPIAHTHPIAIHGGLDPLNHELWLRFDRTMMERSDALLVAMMTGWRESHGIRMEMGFFESANKPIHFMDLDNG